MTAGHGPPEPGRLRVTVVDTEAAGEAVAAAAVAAGSSAACRWQHYGSTIAVKKSTYTYTFKNTIILL